MSKCSMCQGLHSIRNCFKSKALNAKKRQDIVRRNRLCFNCLSNVHVTQNCTSTFTCSTCKQKHHSLLHTSKPANATHVHEPSSTGTIPPSAQIASSSAQLSQSSQSENTTSSTRSASAYNTYIAENSKAQTVLLATALIKVFTTVGQPLMLLALLDPGSEATFISDSAAQLLNLKRKGRHVNILGVGETKANVSKHTVSLTIFSNYNENFKVQLNALVLPRLTAVLPTHNISCANWSHLQNIQLADPTFNKPSKIDILLGSDVYPSILLEGVIKGAPGTPMAQRTEFG